MKSNYYSGLFLISIVFVCASCGLFKVIDDISKIKIPSSCQSYVPQSHKFGTYYIDIKANKDRLQIGDTIHLNLKLSQAFYDSISRQNTNVTKSIAVFVRLTTVSSQSNNSPFGIIDTTIYNVFDQYFKTRMLKGTRTTPYTFDCAYSNGYWELSIQYIALKEGTYYVDSNFRLIKTGEPDLPAGQCMLGNSETFNAKTKFKSTNNQLSRIFPVSAYSPEDYFGFIVE